MFWGKSVPATPGGHTCTQQDQSRDIERTSKAASHHDKSWMDQSMLSFNQVFHMSFCMNTQLCWKKCPLLELILAQSNLV
jgi:hypothetical protein